MAFFTWIFSMSRSNLELRCKLRRTPHFIPLSTGVLAVPRVPRLLKQGNPWLSWIAPWWSGRRCRR